MTTHGCGLSEGLQNRTTFGPPDFTLNRTRKDSIYANILAGVRNSNGLQKSHSSTPSATKYQTSNKSTPLELHRTDVNEFRAALEAEYARLRATRKEPDDITEEQLTIEPPAEQRNNIESTTDHQVSRTARRSHSQRSYQEDPAGASASPHTLDSRRQRCR